jgi:hypothetical protein
MIDANSNLTTPDTHETTPTTSKRKSRERGKLEGKVELILEQLALRFGELPARSVERVRNGTPSDLQRWAKRVLVLPTLDDVLAPRATFDRRFRTTSLFAAIAHEVSDDLRQEMMDIVDELEAHGNMPGDWIRGQACGEASGRAIGEDEGIGKLFLYLLSFRFGSVSRRNAGRVKDCVETKDTGRIYHWATRLFTASTPEEVFTSHR